jgi:hypothetical protein
MTQLSNGTVVTDIENSADNQRLADRGYTIRYIETYHRAEDSESFILWDAPQIEASDLPY